MQTGGNLVARVVELAASMQHGHHDLCGADATVLHDADRDAAAIVLHSDRTVEMDGDDEAVTKACQVLVDRVVDCFPDEVVQR